MTDSAHPVLCCQEASDLEKGILGGNPASEWEAIQRAGRGLARAVLQDYLEIGPLPKSPFLLVLAGKGHNAADALVAAKEILAARPAGRVEVIFPLGEGALNPLARQAWDQLRQVSGESISSTGLRRDQPLAPQLEKAGKRRCQIFLDGLFGMNFKPPFRPPMDELVIWANEEISADLRAAVDLPTGISDAPTDLAIRADFTYMTGSAKQPLFSPGHAEWAGRLRYLDLGFFEAGQREGQRQVLLPAILRPLAGLRPPMAHKRKFGHLIIMGGSRLMPGAILMSILAAIRSGVGLVTALVPESLVPAFATEAPEAMWVGCPETDEGGLALETLSLLQRFLPKATAVLIGPGVGTEPETQALLEEASRRLESPLVLDAEALQEKVMACLASRAAMRGRVVVTPHMGEYKRIARRDFQETGEEGLLEYAAASGIHVLLKGPPFSRFCDGRSIAYGLAGGPVLARGGSGDILAGMTGALAARAPDQLSLAVGQALVWHGLAGEALARERGHEAVRTTEILDYLPTVLRRPAAD